MAACALRRPQRAAALPARGRARRCQRRARQAPPAHLRRAARATLGFVTEDVPSARRQAEALTKQASTLLLYCAPLTSSGGAAGPALLLLAALLAAGGEGAKVAEAYGVWYRAMGAEAPRAGCACNFREYLLERVLDGENAYGAACAAGGSAGAAAAAARADLDALQAICAGGDKLSEWVREAGGELPGRYCEAAMAGPVAGPARADAAAAFGGGGEGLMVPASAAARAELRAAVAASSQWSSQLESVAACYARHGNGVLARSPVATWDSKTMAFVDAPARLAAQWAAASGGDASGNSKVSAALTALAEGSEGRGAVSVVSGPRVRAEALQACAAAFAQRGVLTVLVEPSPSARASLCALGEAIRESPKRKIAVLYGSVGVGEGDASARALSDAATDALALDNVHLIVTTSTAEADVSPGLVALEG